MKSWSLKAKLLAACLLVGLFTLSATIISFWSISATSHAYHEMAMTAMKMTPEEFEKIDDEADSIEARSLNLVILFGGIGFFGIMGMGFIFSKMTSTNIGRISSDLRQVADTTSSSSSEMTESSRLLSRSASSAAASLEETVSSLEELSSIVKTNADNAREANAISQKSKESAEQGEKEIKKLIEAMSEMAQGSKKIEEITTVIEDIAFQTNLLALNAAVEAARAGEQGRGFAVVADAVRNLAQRSASAAKDISNLISSTVQKSTQGAEIATQSGAVLSEIVTQVKKVADLNSEISVASQEQATGLEQISKAMNDLDKSVQSNAGSAVGISDSAKNLSGQGGHLKKLSVELHHFVHGAVGFDEVKATVAEPKAEKAEVVKPKPKVITPTPKAEVSKVVPIQAAKKASKAAQVIPFDEDIPKATSTDGKERKIGNLDGF
ncbi:MAG: methyl-accepting chemotaxis protein [Pseudobdellovibrionaceae bacterium]